MFGTNFQMSLYIYNGKCFPITYTVKTVDVESEKRMDDDKTGRQCPIRRRWVNEWMGEVNWYNTKYRIEKCRGHIRFVCTMLSCSHMSKSNIHTTKTISMGIRWQIYSVTYALGRCSLNYALTILMQQHTHIHHSGKMEDVIWWAHVPIVRIEGDFGYRTHTPYMIAIILLDPLDS